MGDVLEYVTCKKCGIQQKKENFWYCAARHDVCKFCNKKTNVMPGEFKATTKEIHNHLRKIVYDPKNETSILFQMKMVDIFEFLERQICREAEE